MKMNATERTERREQIKATKAHLGIVVDVFQATREETPAATVADLVNRLGYETAREAVAELVNTVGAWDGRIYEYVREWAQSVETAATRDELETHGIYQPGDIHPAHINQIGQAMREYTPAEDIPAEEPADPAAEAEQPEERRTMKKVSVYEDNGGGIHAIVQDGNKIQNIISGFEDSTLNASEFIDAAKGGYEYDQNNYSGLTMEQVAQEIAALDDLIAEITADNVELYPRKMGIAGMILFGIDY